MQHQQHKTALFLGVCLAAACHGGMAMSMSSHAMAESQATAWLRAHRGAPQQDELAELKSVNPTAYGLVKALLMKRSLGLLDPKHPTASFAPASPRAADDESAAQGPQAFEKIAEESGEKPKPQVALAYPDVDAAPAHHDWLNWKPSQGATDDDAMVKNVLGAAAELKASPGEPANLRGQGQTVSDGEAGEGLQWKDAPAADSVGAVAPAAQTPLDVDAKPKAAMSQENSYLTGIDFGLGSSQRAQAQKPEASQENSYLTGFSFGSDAAPPAVAVAAAPAEAPASFAPAHMAQLGVRAATTKADSHDYLASFSWDDASSQKAAPSATTAAPQAKSSGSGHRSNALLAWLGGSAAAAVAPAPKATPAPQQHNGYMMDLA